ncbi:ankyrin repeat domain-containing protein [Thiotrichales bacterium 19X7-9]|nr:ankyrin repeat domain-containing protein [Thiotrichales bacterium 19X7-9]
MNMDILAAMKALGYNPDEEGVCFGIAVMAALAHLRNDFESFQRRMEFIHRFYSEKPPAELFGSAEITNFLYKLYSIESFKEKIKLAEVKRIHEEPLDEDDHILLSIKPFFDSISLYTNCLGSDPDVIKNFRSIQNCENIDKANVILNGQHDAFAIDDQKNYAIYAQSESIRIFTHSTLLEYIKDNLKEGLSINLYDIDHALNIGKHGNEYCFVSHDIVITNSNLDTIVSKSMEYMEQNQQQEIVACAQVLGSQKPEHGIVQSYEKATINELSKFTYTGKLLAFALQYGNTEAVKDYIAVIKEANVAAKRKHNFLLKIMKSDDNQDAENHFSMLIEKENEYTKELLLSTVDGSPGLFLALQKGHAETIKAYMDGIKALDLPCDMKNDLILANGSKTTGLQIAFEYNQANAIKAYIVAIKDFNLKLEVLRNILLAKNINGIAVLFIACCRGYSEAVTAYFDGLKSLNIQDQEVLKELLLAKGNINCDKDNIDSSLYAACLNGHSETITAYFKGLHDLNVSHEVLEAILLEKNQGEYYGSSNLHIALHNGHSQAVSAYLKGLKALNLDQNVLKEVLLAKDSFGLPGLFVAFEAGHTEAVVSYIKGLIQLDLAPEVIAELLLVQAHDGTLGIQAALDNKKDSFKAIKNKLKAMGVDIFENMLDKVKQSNLNISKEKKEASYLFDQSDNYQYERNQCEYLKY